LRRAVEQSMGGFNPFGGLEEMGKQNLAMMERAMTLFAPFRPVGAEAPEGGDAARLAALQAEVEELKRQLEALKGKG
jgi:polyhydroxyalkanoate synthesis regulator protein